MVLVKHMYVFAALCFNFHVIYFFSLTTMATGMQIPVTTAGPTKKSGGKPVKTTTTLAGIRAVPTDRPRTTASIATKKKGKPPATTTTTTPPPEIAPAIAYEIPTSMFSEYSTTTEGAIAPAIAYEIPTSMFSEYSTTTEGAIAPAIAYEIPTSMFSEYSTTTEGAIAPAIAYEIPTSMFSEYSTTTEGAIAPAIAMTVFSEYSTTTEGAIAPATTVLDPEMIVPGPATESTTGSLTTSTTESATVLDPEMIVPGPATESTTGSLTTSTTESATVLDPEMIVPGPATESTTGSLTTSTTESTTVLDPEMIVPGPATESTTGSLTTSTTESATVLDPEMIVPGPATESTTGSLTTSTTESATVLDPEMIVPGPATESTTGSLTTSTTESATALDPEMIVPGPATESTTGSLTTSTTESATVLDPEMIVPGPATESTTGSLTTSTTESATGSGTTSTAGSGTTSTARSGTTSTTGSGTTSTTGSGKTSTAGSGTTSITGSATTSTTGSGTTSTTASGTTSTTGSGTTSTAGSGTTSTTASGTTSTTGSGTTSTTTAVTTSTTTSSGLEHHQLGFLLQSVLAGYDRRIRPRKDQSRFIAIFSDFVPFSIIEFNTQEQKFAVMGYFKMDWRDAFLKWNSDDYGGTTTLRIPVQSMWIPKLVIDKSVDENGGIVGDMKTDIAMVSRKGYVRWFPEGIYGVSCLVTIRFYPFDIQSCTFSYYIADEDNSTVNLKHDGEVDLSEYIENAEWKLLNVTATRDLVGSNYVVHFRFDVERRGGFAMFTLVVPLLMLSMLSGATFLIPIETGEKCSFSVTLFLAYGIFETIVIDTLPHNSLDVSYFILYITALLVISVVLTFYTILQAKIFDAIGDQEFGGCKRSNPGAEPDPDKLTWGTFLRKMDTFVFVGFLLVFGGVSSLFAFAMGEKFDFV